jgi:hypothetical protein
MKKQLILALALLYVFCGKAQNVDLTQKLYETYKDFKEPTLDKRRIKHADLQPLLAKFDAMDGFTVTKVGESIGGRSLSLVSVGSGDTSIFLWSQMHGDEPTATQATFDILNFLASDAHAQEKRELLSKVTIHFLPMLNPDGAELYQRRNLLGVDINRDALHLQSPESQTLKRVRDSLEADYGFNLHDQSTYYNAERTEKPATISYLAPAFNYEKDISEKRGDAMKIIVFMNNIIQKYAPGQVGRYNDDFEPRAFGDNIQKWGTSTILIESGGYPNDVEKQEIRKLNYVSILSAIYTIANESFRTIPLTDYAQIPENDRKLFDLKIVGATYMLYGNPYRVDLGIQRLEVDLKDHTDFWYSSRVIDQGDLSTYYGYETLVANGHTIVPGKVYPKNMTSMAEVAQLDVDHLLKNGFAYLRMENIPTGKTSVKIPLHLLGKNYELPEFLLEPGKNPTFFLEQAGQLRYAVINGFLLDLSISGTALQAKFEAAKGNGMIYR